MKIAQLKTILVSSLLAISFAATSQVAFADTSNDKKTEKKSENSTTARKGNVVACSSPSGDVVARDKDGNASKKGTAKRKGVVACSSPSGD